MRPGGKLDIPARLNAVAAGMLFQEQCQLTGRRYLVDTGATFSLIPHKSSEPQARHSRLISPGGQPIRCWGKERLHSRLFMWTFIKTEVTFPILGVDFLQTNRLSVAVATNQLTNNSTSNTFCLIEQPRGHTASIMLPANVPEWNKTACPPVAPPCGRQPAAPPTRRPRQFEEETSPSPGRRCPQPLSLQGSSAAGGLQSPPPLHSTDNRRPSRGGPKAWQCRPPLVRS
jgi:hypothetical protein